MLRIVVLAALLSAAGGEYFEITVKQGDTLSKIASHYLKNPDSWPELLRYNAIADPNRILPGMKLKVPGQLASTAAKTEGKASGPSESAWSAINVRGTVEKVAGKDRTALAKGDYVEPGTRIESGAGGGAEFLLPDQSIMQIGANAKIEIAKSEPATVKGTFSTLVKSFGGFLRAKVHKLGAGATFEVHTPTAVAGVRGTEFTVDFDEASGVSKLSVQEGKVAVAAGGKELVLNPGQGTIAKKDAPPTPPAELPAAPIMKRTSSPDGTEALEWERPKGATDCGFLISSDAEFKTLVKETSTMDSLGDEQQNLPPGDYYAKAFCLDKNGLRGKLSETLEFSAE